MFSTGYPKPSDSTALGAPWISTLNYIQAASDPNWSFHMHTHESALEISYVFSGKGSIYFGGRHYLLNEGDIVIKNPGISHAENSNPDDPLEQICILIEDFQTGNEPLNTMPVGDFSPILHANEKKGLLNALFREILDSTISIPSPDLVYVNMLLRTSLAAIMNILSSQLYDRQAGSDHQKMKEVRSYIDEHFMEDLSLSSIAEYFHISEYYLARQFRKYTSFTVNNYLISCRIGEAQRRLIHEADRIDEIAVKCGFSNLSYFYTSFRKNVGCTPSQFRRSYRHSAE